MIEHVFFDLDHTLWDFERNSEECLLIIQNQYVKDSTLHADFMTNFRTINKALWRKLEFDQITHQELRKSRFKQTLESVNVPCSEELSLEINTLFIEHLQQQTHLMNGALDVLNYLKPKYKIHLISNGYLDIQTRKMEKSGILNYFSAIVTSDVANSRKPNKAIFDYALQAAQASRKNSIYIGDDDVADKEGAKNAEVSFIHLNIHAQKSSPTEIRELSELVTIL